LPPTTKHTLGAERASPDRATVQTIFISYRRSDAPAASRQLATALKARFGEENVFFDTKDIELGADWRSEITQRVAASDIVIAVVGQRWVALAEERGRRLAQDQREEDVLRLEIETALVRKKRVIPVLVDGADLPSRAMLPRPFKPLADIQLYESLRHTSWDDDVDRLIDKLERARAQIDTSKEPTATPLPSPRSSPAPDGLSGHFDDVVEYLTDGLVVPFLGSDVNAVGRDEPFTADSGSLPDARELALYLADIADKNATSEGTDLAQASQAVYMLKGEQDLHRALRELLKVDRPPGPLHRFLARMPGMFRDHDLERYQLIVTANYDTALERAFDEANEPYDLVVFMATGEHKGRFLHIPWWDAKGQEWVPIFPANDYRALPIDENELERTVILKLHGGAVDARDRHQLKDNFVITEDDYIGYLSQESIENVVPSSIRDKLQDSHALCLGYRMSDWNLRVFLQRVWGGRGLPANSWAIQSNPDRLEKKFWDKWGAELLDMPLGDYLSELEMHLVAKLQPMHVES
jgi:hypothetical protein